MDNVAIFCSKYLVFLIPLFLLWLIIKAPKQQRLEMAFALIIAGIISFLLAKLAGAIYDNPRPFVSDGTPSLISHGTDNGFPSEHVLFATTLTTLTFFYSRRLFAASVVIVLLVGWGRVAVHVHHGVDILAGMILGVIAGYLGWWLAQRFANPEKDAEPKVSNKV